MKKLLLIVTFLTIPFFGTAQVFQENFDGNGPGFAAWTLIDVDGLTHATAVAEFDASAWIRKNRGGPTPNYGGPDGNYAAMSASWYNPTGTSNDWLISPQITLPAASTYLQWASKAQDPSAKDGYKVMLAPNGGNTVADFTVELFTIGEENEEWTTRYVQLNAYVGTTVRIAFVNNSNDKFVLLVDDIVVNLSPTAAPACATLVSPANNAMNIDYIAPLQISWSAATTGSPAMSYDVYLDTNSNPTTLVGTTNALTFTAQGLLPSTTYYWKVIAKNAFGEATGCTVYSFKTAENPFAPYCGPIQITFTTEPITLVKFAGINNTTPAATAGAPGHEDFLSKTGNVNQGSSYQMTLKGNTNGNYDNRFVVFIDWNQNGVLNDAGEVYEITTLLKNSTGVDAKEVMQTLAVPADALLGNTRMRVKKIFGMANFLDPCAGASFGQVEDYTIAVGGLAVSDASKAQLKVYPNPVVDILNIESADKVKSVQVFDLTGKSVSSHMLNAVKSQINLSKLTSGVYVVNIETEKGIQSVKIVKK